MYKGQRQRIQGASSPSLSFYIYQLHRMRTSSLLAAVFSRFFGSSASSHTSDTSLVEAGNELASSDLTTSSAHTFIQIQDFLGAAVCYPQPWEKTWGIAIGVILVLYLACILARVVDIYLVTSLEILCRRLNLPHDIAGVTFLALGGSMPSLAIHTFATIEGTEVGVGTVIGSAIFNMTVGVAFVALVSPPGVLLHWGPLFRDGVFYLLCLGFIVFCFKFNATVFWWQAAIMVSLYIGFIATLLLRHKQNEKIAREQEDIRRREKQQQETAEKTKGWDEEAARAAAAAAAEYERTSLLENGSNSSNQNSNNPNGNSSDSSAASSSSDPEADVFLTNKPIENPNIFVRAFRVVNYPTDWLYRTCIPDCEKIENRHRYGWTFAVSLFFVLIWAFLLMSIVQYMGCVSGTDQALDGLIVLALAASMPDVISMGVSASRGLGVMAMSGLVGSNIFDLLLGLGLPWLVSIGSSGKPIKIENTRVYMGVLLCGLTTVILALSLIMHRMRLYKTVAVLPLIMYITYVVSEAIKPI